MSLAMSLKTGSASSSCSLCSIPDVSARTGLAFEDAREDELLERIMMREGIKSSGV